MQTKGVFIFKSILLIGEGMIESYVDLTVPLKKVIHENYINSFLKHPLCHNVLYLESLFICFGCKDNFTISTNDDIRDFP